MRLFPSVNERETLFAPGKFFRITFSNLAIFLNLSVVAHAILNRASTFFATATPDSAHQPVNHPDERRMAA
jgi:hypothetical protein